MIEYLRKRFTGKSIVLLGFGREGQASYSRLREAFPGKRLTIADASEAIRDNPLIAHDDAVALITGPGYLEQLQGFDAIFRSPGIPVWQLLQDQNHPGGRIRRDQITSQTEIFLECFAGRVIGVTGTKGKSTTASLIHHILKTAGKDALLAGNIGSPVFHIADLVGPETIVVFELSSHQLEFITVAPHISVLLNLFQEHLDAYESYGQYQQAKVNVTRYQQEEDFLVYNMDDALVSGHVQPFCSHRRCYPFSVAGETGPGSFLRDGWACFSNGRDTVPVWQIHQDRFLRGEHNLKNILAAISVAMIHGIDPESVSDAVATFKGLEHRLEYVGEFGKIHFYNDSIATIPEACMEAVRAIPKVDTLVAGGFDRGIEYDDLASFLGKSGIRNIILAGEAGRRIGGLLEKFGNPDQKLFYINRFDDFREIAFRETLPGHACLLSPAAASYDEFRNFEERGRRFRDLVTH